MEQMEDLKLKYGELGKQYNNLKVPCQCTYKIGIVIVTINENDGTNNFIQMIWKLRGI